MTDESPEVIKARREAEVSSDLFGQHLRHFVERWAPPADWRDWRERDRFQQDLMRLMHTAMSHQSRTLAFGVECYASSALLQRSMAPLVMIREKENGK